jgi:GntR family transcriptional repressor for pyruvate dehydrogenase complex
VAQSLLARVVSGALPVGSLLPKETELAQAFSVNRSVIREAVKLLEVHRLLRPVRKRGTVVLDPVASLSPAVLGCMLEPPGGPVDRAFLRDLLEVRAHLDEYIAGLAAERRTDADLAHLDAGVARVRDGLERGDGYFEAIEELSLALSRATHNRVLEMLSHWNRLVTTHLVDVFRATRPTSPAYVEGVSMLVALIRQRNVDDARALVRAYHAWAIPRLFAAAALRDGEPLDRIAAAPVLENPR